MAIDTYKRPLTAVTRDLYTDQVVRLKEISVKTGKGMAELIRDAIDKTYMRKKKDE